MLVVFIHICTSSLSFSSQFFSPNFFFLSFDMMVLFPYFGAFDLGHCCCTVQVQCAYRTVVTLDLRHHSIAFASLMYFHSRIKKVKKNKIYIPLKKSVSCWPFASQHWLVERLIRVATKILLHQKSTKSN